MQERRTLLATPAGTAWLASNGNWIPARHLQVLSNALVDLATGRIPRLLVLMPPRHGKSNLTSEWFPFWYLGHYPHRRIILTSYEADYAASWSRKVRDHFTDLGRDYFGLEVSSASSAADRWDFHKLPGGMNAAGAGGAITGKGAHALLIDDPVKNDEEARSKTLRDKKWEWLRATALSRLEPDGVAGIVMTHWHLDDMAGRILRGELEGPPWTVIKMPAIATATEVGWPHGIGRRRGDALWPERYDADVLGDIKATMGAYWWAALYQQDPIPEGGAVFKPEWLTDFTEADQPRERVAHACRFWDVAATQGAGDYTVGTLMLLLRDGSFVVEDVVRGQWDPPAVDATIRRTALEDARRFGDPFTVRIREEQEAGSSGKAVVSARAKLLVGFDYRGEPPRGDKEARAYPFAAQCGVHNVKIRRAAWNKPWIEELLLFPNGPHDDQVDAGSGAFNELALHNTQAVATITTDPSWQRRRWKR